ncbi:hypothetical protein PGTUg99_035826 [Puccinia graminis f. sp. tritici]|uniref:Uncharacterized protein n=1 Tax=Puccinia graminis f. sp. tritici TaxID=56615 RepID=A0A5B0P7E2_PUCGR|nr:hypothetical protein PGTUg99_035826 [Puccinia graminis f. sp. tritici]
MCSNRSTCNVDWSLNITIWMQSINLSQIFSASFNSFKKHACSRTPGIPNVLFLAPTA